MTPETHNWGHGGERFTAKGQGEMKQRIDSIDSRKPIAKFCPKCEVLYSTNRELCPACKNPLWSLYSPYDPNYQLLKKKASLQNVKGIEGGER